MSKARPQDRLHQTRWTEDGDIHTYGVVTIERNPDDGMYRLKGLRAANTQRIKGTPRQWAGLVDAKLHVERNYQTLCAIIPDAPIEPDQEYFG